MLPPQQGRDDSLRARLAQGREANLPKPINAWGTGRDDAIKGVLGNSGNLAAKFVDANKRRFCIRGLQYAHSR
jgi:hypothetical protein